MSVAVQNELRDLRRKYEAQTSVIETLYKQLAEVHREILELKSTIRVNGNAQNDRRGTDRGH